MGLDALNEFSVRERLIELEQNINPDIGMYYLAYCQLLFNKHDSAKLTAYRWLAYMDQLEKAGIPAVELEEARTAAAKILNTGPNEIDHSKAAEIAMHKIKGQGYRRKFFGTRMILISI